MPSPIGPQPPLLPAEPLTEHPNFTQIPNGLLDKHMALLENGELRVLLYITRRTFGFGRTSADMTIQQIATGYVLPSGKRADNGAGMDTRSVQRSLKTLIEKGLVKREMRFDESKHPLPSSYALVTGSSEEIDSGISTTIKISQDDAQGGVSTTIDSLIDPGVSTTTYKKESPVEEEIKETNNPLPPSEETQEQNTNAIAEPGVLREIEFTEFDDWTNDGGDAVIAALRRQKGIKLSPKQRQTIREKLVMVLIREGLIDETAYRFALWAREHNKAGEPQLICYGRWLKCLKGEESLDIDPPDLPSTPVSLPPIDLQPISPKSPPDIPPASPHNGLPPLALRWNEVVHSGPPVVAWKEQSNGDFLLRTLMSDLAFQRESETALAKAEKLCAAKHPKGSYLTFGWFIKPGKWCEVLNGQHDWLLGDGPAQPKKSVFQQAKEQMRADREAKKADKNLDSGGG